MPRTGQTLGAYRIESILGRGAMGVVYRGAGIDDGEPVAIKIVRTDLLVGPERDAILARFRQEASIGMRLRHPRIVRVHDYGELDQVIYLAMDFIPGQELGRLLERQPDLPLGMSLAIMLQVLNALAYAHQQDVIHRDVKPANILVRQDYGIALTDFGIAHVSGSELTQTGDLLGSPLYMAPEQLRGEPLDCRADLFSAGVVLYYLLARRKPFAADSMAVLMQKVLGEDPPPPSTLNRTLPAVFDPVLRRALAKDRRDRFASALDFAAALRQARTAAAEATVILPGRRALEPAVPLAPASSDQTTVVISNLDGLGGRVAALVRQCLAGRATGPRLDQLAQWLEAWFVLAERPPTSPVAVQTERQRMQQWCAGEPLVALADLIERTAPLPGRVIEQPRGDWLELIRLFVLLQDAGRRLGAGQAAEMARVRFIQELTGAFLNYASTLNRLLYGDDTPHLARISADFMRFDLLQLALVELGAEAEGRAVQQTLLLFANQVMGKVNVLIRKFLDRPDPLGRFGVASLLVEVEDLIVLAQRLLQGGELAGVEATEPGALVTDVIGNVRELSRLIGQELYQQILEEPLTATGAAAEQAQALFVGRLRQLGLLYRFAIRLETGEPVEPLKGLATQMHGFLRMLAERLLAAARAPENLEQPEASGRLWARLSVIAELAEQLGWLELRQRILKAIRGRVVVV